MDRFKESNNLEKVEGDEFSLSEQMKTDKDTKRQSFFSKKTKIITVTIYLIITIIVIATCGYLYYRQSVLVPRYQKGLESLGLSKDIDANKIGVSDILRSGVDIKKIISNPEDLSVDEIKKLAKQLGYDDSEIDAFVPKQQESFVNKTAEKTKANQSTNSKTKSASSVKNGDGSGKTNDAEDNNYFLESYEDYYSYDYYANYTPLPESNNATIITSLKGKGTESDPYKLYTVQDITEFSSLIAKGSFKQNDIISLENDIDFKGKELQPIGTFSHPFSLIFEGNGHTISNVIITKVLEKNNGVSRVYSGFFGVSSNPTIRNLNLVNVSGNVNYKDENCIYDLGILFGCIQCSKNVEIYNCKIDGKINADVSCGRIGGICGFLFGNDSCKQIMVKQTEVNLVADVCNSYYSQIGSAFGNFTTLNETATLRDLCCNSFVNTLNVGQCDIGGFGCLNVYNDSGNLYLEDSFFKTKHTDSRDVYANDHAVIGGIITECEPWGNLKLTNIFGNINGSSNLFLNQNKKAPIVNNCKYCETLPTSCGFDSNVWDLSDLSCPKLK